MRHTGPRYAILLFLFVSYQLAAQRVMYAPVADSRNTLRFTVAGKTGDYYWVHKEQRKRHFPKQAADWMKEEQILDVYDARLQLMNSIPAAVITESTLKKWLVCGRQFFDELVLQANLQQTVLRMRRYTATGVLQADSMIAQFPFAEPGHRFILVTCADKSKTLLLGFESVKESAPKLHAIIFDAAWKQLSNIVFEHPFITQPFIQDDFFCFPSSVNNAPVQIANNGEWLMASPSRSNNNFLLLHFDGSSNNISYKEIVLPALYRMEDIALSINNEKGEAFAGILSNYRQSVYKNVHVTHYSFAGDAFDFDSSYRFSTLAGMQTRNKRLARESFLAVPDLGFMLLKEYGRSTTNWYDQPQYSTSWDPEFVLTGNSNTNAPANFPVNANSYTRYHNTGAITANYDRGDLSAFYFPGCRADSAWSGFINKKQITELNAPALSYLFIPLPGKLVFLYNSMDRDESPFANTTVLNPQGHLLSDREIISWKADQSLLVQQAVQIAANEVAVPYVKNQQKGFAIIRF